MDDWCFRQTEPHAKTTNVIIVTQRPIEAGHEIRVDYDGPGAGGPRREQMVSAGISQESLDSSAYERVCWQRPAAQPTLLTQPTVAPPEHVHAAYTRPRVITAEAAMAVCDEMRSAEMEMDDDRRQLQRLWTCHGTRDLQRAAEEGHAVIRLAIAAQGGSDVAILCGFVRPHKPPRQAATFVVAQLYVCQSHRRHRLAMDLLGAAAHEARTRGATAMELSIGVRENTATNVFWHRFGFRRNDNDPMQMAVGDAVPLARVLRTCVECLGT